LVAIFVLPGCEKDPVDRLTNPLSEGAVPGYSGTYIVYDDELKTGGNLALIPGGENQEIDLSDRSAPRGNLRQVRYTWNGLSVSTYPAGGYQQLFAGFIFMVGDDVNTLQSTPGRDLSGPGYTQMTFSVRGWLSEETSLRVEGPSTAETGFTPARVDIDRSELSLNVWKSYTLTVPATDFNNVRTFITLTIQYDQPPRTTLPSNGGTIYIDDIRYSR
jgi:hypothetical protein